jgi:hypothetical protein
VALFDSSLSSTGTGISANAGDSTTSLEVNRSTVVADGDAISGFDSDLVVRQSTLQGTGFGVQSRGDAASVEVVNSTITGHREYGVSVVGHAGTVHSSTISNAASALLAADGGELTVTSSIVSEMEGVVCFGAVVSGGHNVLDTDDCGFTATGDQVVADVGLGALGDNGGTTETFLPAATSPAVDAGAGCPDVDQRGVSRPQDGDDDGTAACDAGAVELAVEEPPAPPTAPPATPAGASPRFTG